jgi:hypothetical protein
VLRKKVIPEGKKGLEEKKNKKREREREKERKTLARARHIYYFAT